MTQFKIKPQYVSKPAFTVAGLRISTKPKSPEIPRLWDAFVARIRELQNRSEPYASYGVMTNAGDAMDYMAGNPVSHIDKIPEGMTHWSIPEQTYAVFKKKDYNGYHPTQRSIPEQTYAVFKATIPNIMEVFSYIYQSWLPTSGFRQADSPVLERYGETFSPENPVVDIYIPVQPRV